MDFALSALLFAVGLFLSMLILLEVGRRIGLRRIAQDPEGARVGTGAVEGAIFGLLGLFLAFTFSGAVSRFDTRRQLIVEEANHVGTAYLRVDLLPGVVQPAVRELFRKYLDSRLETYRRLLDVAAAKDEITRSIKLQGEIWTQAVAATRSREAHPDAGKLLLPALNAMIDITTTRVSSTQLHPPVVLFVMLFGLALGGSLLAGYGMASSEGRSWIHMLGFALAMAAAVYVILDVEYPRLGLIRVDAFDQTLVELRESMK
jgi:hypothetical protein